MREGLSSERVSVSKDASRRGRGARFPPRSSDSPPRSSETRYGSHYYAGFCAGVTKPRLAVDRPPAEGAIPLPYITNEARRGRFHAGQNGYWLPVTRKKTHEKKTHLPARTQRPYARRPAAGGGRNTSPHITNETGRRNNHAGQWGYRLTVTPQKTHEKKTCHTRPSGFHPQRSTTAVPQRYAYQRCRNSVRKHIATSEKTCANML